MGRSAPPRPQRNRRLPLPHQWESPTRQHRSHQPKQPTKPACPPRTPTRQRQHPSRKPSKQLHTDNLQPAPQQYRHNIHYSRIPRNRPQIVLWLQQYPTPSSIPQPLNIHNTNLQHTRLRQQLSTKNPRPKTLLVKSLHDIILHSPNLPLPRPPSKHNANGLGLQARGTKPGLLHSSSRFKTNSPQTNTHNYVHQTPSTSLQ